MNTQRSIQSEFGIEGTKPWTDAETLRRLYHGQGLTQQEVASRLGCSASTIRNWLNRHGIETKDPAEENRVEYCRFRTSERGYERWKDSIAGKTVFVHCLVLIAEGHDPEAVFGRENHTHHENGIRWDNRPENLKLLSAGEHSALHHDRGSRSDPHEDEPWRDEKLLRRLHHEEELTKAEIADQLDCTPATIRNWFNRFDIETVNHDAPPWQDKELLREAYQEHTSYELADRWDCSFSTVLKWLHKFGIETREPVAHRDGAGGDR